MKRGFLFAAMLCAPVVLFAASAAAEQTWTGKISDSACGKKHEEAAENHRG